MCVLEKYATCLTGHSKKKKIMKKKITDTSATQHSAKFFVSQYTNTHAASSGTHDVTPHAEVGYISNNILVAYFKKKNSKNTQFFRRYQSVYSETT